jgi:multisubunit Na+/H+ antiporter MnhE subunit
LVRCQYLTEKLSWVDLFKPVSRRLSTIPTKKIGICVGLPPFRPVQGRGDEEEGQFMRAGIAFLIVAYMLSQFYRAFLAVLAPRWRPRSARRPGISRVPRASGSRPSR